ncbi:MAG: AIR synthase related protein [bacterium]
MSLYNDLGVESDKAGIAKIFDGMNENLFLRCFCRIARDIWKKGWVMVKHADGSGSKSMIHYLFYLSNNNILAMSDDASDALVMNSSDVAAAGFVDKLVFTNIVDISRLNVDKDLILRQVVEGLRRVKELYSKYGIEIIYTGGETADLPDQVSVNP